jgi:putative transposase
MARRPRLQFSGAVYHVMSRGNRKAAIFEDDHDRRCFWNTLSDTAIHYGVRVYGACLLDNHYHALLDTPRDNVSDAMRDLNGLYSQTSNKRHNRSGHTFEARFHSTVVEYEKYLRRAARYVVRNPVKAGCCPDVSEWPWSTYRATAGLEPAPKWLYLDWLPWAFNADSLSGAQVKYRRYVNSRTAAKRELDPNATAFGSKAFERAAKERLERNEQDRRLPRPRQSWRPRRSKPSSLPLHRWSMTAIAPSTRRM